MSTRREGDPARQRAALLDESVRRTGGEGRGGEGPEGKGRVVGSSVEEEGWGSAKVEEDDDAIPEAFPSDEDDDDSPTDNPREHSTSAGVPRRGGVDPGLFSLVPRRGRTNPGALGGETTPALEVEDVDEARRGTVGMGPG